jgi:hypothetical protein
VWICHADHATPSIRKQFSTNFVDKRRSLGRYSSFTESALIWINLVPNAVQWQGHFVGLPPQNCWQLVQVSDSGLLRHYAACVNLRRHVHKHADVTVSHRCLSPDVFLVRRGTSQNSMDDAAGYGFKYIHCTRHDARRLVRWISQSV